MTVEVRRFGDVVVIACGRGRRERVRYCVACLSMGRERAADLLCDWPLSTGKTCDKSMCHEHATRIRPGIDYCRDHKAVEAHE